MYDSLTASLIQTNPARYDTPDRQPFAVLWERNGTAARRRLRSLPVGVGRSIAQYGEILQGQLDSHNGHGKRRFLVSLPCDKLYSEVIFTPAYDQDLTVNPSHKKKVWAAVELCLRLLGYEDVGGSLTVRTNVLEGKGCGSSTADCVAAVRATAAAFGKVLEDETVARLVVNAEHASDNFMFSRVVVFAHRQGIALEDLGPTLPRVDVLGFDTDQDGAVYTLEFPPAEYSRIQLQSFAQIVSLLRRSIIYQDTELLGRVATMSATVNQEFLPKPMFHEIRGIADAADALGVGVAHSGTVMSILLSSTDPVLERKVDAITRQLYAVGINQIERFRT